MSTYSLTLPTDMTNWGVLLLAGAVEVIWSQTIKPTENFTKLLPTLLCIALGALSVYLLSRAMNTLPVGTAYAVFTGIGAIGAITLGALIYRDPVNPLRMLALSLIIGGVALARYAEST